MFVVTHDLYLAEHIVNHLIYLEEGQIVEQGVFTELAAASFCACRTR